MLSAQTELAAAVRREISAARAAARGAVRAAQHEERRAQAALAAARDRQAQLAPRLAGARTATLARLEVGHERRRAALVARLADLASATGPGAATAPWTDWQPTRPARGALPGLYRVGALDDRLPALLPLLDLGHVAVTGGAAATADGLIAGLLLRAIGAAPPGAVRLRVYDPEQLGGSLAGFAPLVGAGLLRFAGPGALPELLDELVEEISRITEQVLAGEYGSLRELAASTGRRPEPWRIAVLLAGPDRPEQAAQLDRIVRTGTACGVHLIGRGVGLPGAATVRLAGGSAAATTSLTGALPVLLDPAPPAALITRTCRGLAAGPPPAAFADLLPEKLWTESSADGLTAPIGEGPDGRLVEVTLGDNPPHALLGGPSGSGKTNLLYAWLAGLTARYSPDELELYLLDFKEGVSFARFAPGRRDPSWLPHLRLVGVNANTDREFGLALLRFLLDELRRRAAAARRHEATKLAELRAEEPGGRWPRIVAVIDEFQVLLDGRDAVTAEAVALLEDLARRGRSQGIHLVLASQDISGIEALWGRPGLIGQFTLRIALPKARRILTETNPAADTVPRYHAVVNPDSGAAGANRIVRLPDASPRDAWQALQERLWRQRAPDAPVPRLFDGDAVPALPPFDPDLAASPTPVALVGARIDVTGRPAMLALPAAPGRNLAVLGTRTADACAVLASAARSLADQCRSAQFSIACFDAGARAAAQALAATLPLAALYDAETAGALLTGALPADADDPTNPHFIIGYGWDAAPALAEPLRRLLTGGPERQVHLLGWWRGVARLRDSLGGVGARFDAVGSWVALDVHGAELAPLSPQPGGPAWYPRAHRALFFDRAVHRVPEVIIPYGSAP